MLKALYRLLVLTIQFYAFTQVKPQFKWNTIQPAAASGEIREFVCLFG